MQTTGPTNGPLTRPFRETVEDRARRDPALKAELEAARAQDNKVSAKR